MMDFDRHLEKLALIGGNALLVLAFAVASITLTDTARDARIARFPDGWRAPQQALQEAPRNDAIANASWAREWTDKR